jgi:hypothetical protein
MAKKFNWKVKSFAEASTNFRRIDKYLQKMNKIYARFDWKKVPKKPRRNGNGGEEPGSKGGKWPPP